jgi:hypothetical protein
VFSFISFQKCGCGILFGVLGFSQALKLQGSLAKPTAKTSSVA